MSRPDDPDVAPPELVRHVPADVAALVACGHLEEVAPGLFRRARLPSRQEVHGEQPTTDRDETQENQ